MKILSRFLLLTVLSLSLALPVHHARAEGETGGDKKSDSKDAGKADDAKAEGGGEKSDEKSGEKSEGGDAKKKKGPTDVSGGRFAGDPIYVRLAPLTLPILNDNEPEQLVTIQITVEVKDFDTADDMHEKMPKIMDSLLQALYGGLSQGSLRDGRVANIGRIKTRALTALQNVETGDHIRDVLIVNMSQRAL